MKYKIIKLVILLSGMLAMANAANLALLPKTGQTDTLPKDPAPAGSDGALMKGKAWPHPRFILDASGDCIIDKLTGLMWLKTFSDRVNGTVNWSSALHLTSVSSWCGYNDWRIPNINEILSLVNYAYSSQENWLSYGSGDGGDPQCDGACFSEGIAGGAWTSTIVAENSNAAWVLLMNDGTAVYEDKSEMFRFSIAPVRGGR
jgi:hypothetical protein